MAGLQPSLTFYRSVAYVSAILQQASVPYEQWLATLAEKTGLNAEQVGYLKVATGSSQQQTITAQFTTDDIRIAIEDLVSSVSGGAVLTKDTTQALSLQIGWLLDCQRYFARRKTPRAVRIVNAAHRRAILAHSTGPINRNLQQTVEELLARS